MIPNLQPGLLLLLAALAYLVSAALYGAGIVRIAEQPRRDLQRAGLIAAMVGVLLHTAGIGLRCVQTHIAPFVTAPDALSAVGWAIAIGFLILLICPMRDRMVGIGAVAMALAFLCVFTGSALSLAAPIGITTDARLLDGNLVNLHVLAIVFAFGFLALASGCGILYLLEDKMLKHKSVAQLLLWRLPSLKTIDNLAFSLVSFAVPLLTVGILAGMIRAGAEHLPFTTWGLEPQTVLSVVTWALYGAYLYLHPGRSLRGARVNTILLLGLAAEISTYFAPSSLHQFG